MMVLRGDGVLVGSVSGGCIEDDLVLRAQEGRLSAGRAEVVTYGVTNAEAMRFGLPCGGTLRLVVEPVREFAWVDAILQRIGSQRLAQRSLDLESLHIAVADAAPDSALRFDGRSLTMVYGPRWRLLVIGAGQTSAYLARMAQALDYQVIVCDPREEMRAAWDVSGTELLSEMPDDAVVALQADARTAIVALTHDPKLDDMALLEALKSPAFYVGALGSARNNAKRRERLALFDLSADEIARLHGPVGLAIGSRTPPEIAVAILAHLISVRNRPAEPAHAAQPATQETCS
jgi:xanthine dehydrogenase accessory factor